MKLKKTYSISLISYVLNFGKALEKLSFSYDSSSQIFIFLIINKTNNIILVL